MDNFQKIRTKYQEKRRKLNWKRKKRYNVLKRNNLIHQQNLYNKKRLINYSSPDDFSFINNTEEVLKYFNDVRAFINQKISVFLDISEITNLTPDSIALQMAQLSDKKSKKIGMVGNSPKNPKFKKIFEESGFYDHVNTNIPRVNAVNNKLWKHSTDNIVKGEIAGKAVEACKNLFSKKNKSFDTDNIYNLLVEAMSNTKNHAKKGKENINWWLYYYIDEEQNIIKYSFIDLGVGIFQSASFKSYKKKLATVLGNELLIKPFLEGKIISSRKTDHEISGKGVKQIIECSAMKEVTKFYIISNDLKIDVKNQNGSKLSTNFAGTFIYFEVNCN